MVPRLKSTGLERERCLSRKLISFNVSNSPLTLLTQFCVLRNVIQFRQIYAIRVFWSDLSVPTTPAEGVDRNG